MLLVAEGHKRLHAAQLLQHLHISNPSRFNATPDVPLFAATLQTLLLSYSPLTAWLHLGVRQQEVQGASSPVVHPAGDVHCTCCPIYTWAFLKRPLL
jgi:hypothetical protein